MKKKTTMPLISLDPSRLMSWANHRAQIDVAGCGDENYQFPDTATLVKRSLASARASGIVGTAKARKTSTTGSKRTCTSAPKAGTRRAVKAKTRTRRGKATVEDIGGKGILPQGRDVIRIIPKIEGEPADKLGNTLVRGATGLQTLMIGRQLDGIVYDNFGQDYGTLHWAKHHMPERYRDGAISLMTQYKTMIPRFKEAVIALLKELEKRNPTVPQPVLLQHAVKLLREQLAQFIFIAKVYADSFAQYRDEVYYHELMAINLFYEQASALFKRVDPDSPDKAADGLDSIVYHVGDRYLARFTSMSLATIPGSKGPIGIHALQMPFNMLDIIAIMFPLLAHEFRHNLLSDTKGYEGEMRAVLKAAIVNDHKAGLYKFVSNDMSLGNQPVKTLDMMVKLMLDSIGEIDADIAGGVLFDGTSYLYNMMLSFPAMLVRGTLSQAKKLLRTESVYKLIPQQDGSVALVFEPHPPDYIRAYIVAAALDEIGFKAEADECRRLADFAVGKPLPTHITWKDGSGEEEHENENENEGEGESQPAASAKKKSDMVIAIPVEDIKAVAPTVARAIIRTKMKSLGGRSTFDMVNWTPAREAKVQKLADLLVAGKSDLPTDIGSIYATYIGGAATLAYWRLIHAGDESIDPAQTAKAVNANAMKMIAALRAKQAKS
jgi:hypothetical protein